MERLSLAQARRVALAAQGFARPRPSGSVDRRHLRALFARVGLVQIDSVSTVVRSHFLPGWSRLGGYDRSLLERLAYRDHELFEYWAHEACLVPVALQPLLRWRMQRASRGVGTYASLARIARERPGFVDAVLGEVAARGPLAAGELSEPGERAGPWWGWGDGKRALEWLFWTGQVSVAGRRASFERLYDLPGRVLPADVLAVPTPDEDAAQRALLLRAASALGVATASDLGDYFRLPAPDTKVRVAELVESAELLPVAVEGWRPAGYVLPGLVVPRRVAATAVLSPFDSLVWERPRTERLFGFTFRLEIYTPAAKRIHGYYVLPFLLGDRLVGRVDLKSDRAAGVLRVLAAHAEPGASHDVAAAALAPELAGLAGWLGLGRVEAADRGELAPALRRALAGEPGGLVPDGNGAVPGLVDTIAGRPQQLTDRRAEPLPRERLVP